MSDQQPWASPSGPQQPGQPPYGQPPYGQVPYGQAPYGQPPYGQTPYGQPPYGQAHYAPPGWYGRVPGEARPGTVTAAGVLGIVTGSLTALGSLFMLVMLIDGERDPATALLTLGLPCAVGLVLGGVRVLQGHAAGLLFGSAVAAIGVLGAALVAGWVVLDDDGRLGVTAFVAIACVLPIVTAVFARLRPVTAWREG